MGTKRIYLGEEAFIHLDGITSDLELRGTERDDIRLDADVEDIETTVEGNGVHVPLLEGSATVRMPKSGRAQVGHIGASLLAKYVEGGLVISKNISDDAVIRYCGPVTLSGDVGSSLLLKYIAGMCEASVVHGDVTAKYIHSLHVSRVGGNFQAAYVDGDIAVDTVDGDFTCRNVEGALAIKHVGGSAKVLSTPSGGTIEDISGDLILRTVFHTDTISRFTCGGDARIKVPRTMHVKFIMPSATNVKVDDDFQTYYEGDQLIASLGEGTAEVHLHAGGDVIISAKGDYTTTEDIEYPLDSELSEELSNISMQMDEQMLRIESLLGGIGERVRQRVERKLAVARRRVKEAQRQVEEAVDSAVVDVPPTSRVTIHTDVKPSVKEPVTNEERLMILQMLEQGTISVNEAEDLLNAME